MQLLNVLKDKEKLQQWIDFLPELEKDQCYYVALFARKKYHPSAKNDKSQCTRFIARTKEGLLRKIAILDTPMGTYTNKDGTPVHEEALALYMYPNPRCMKKATLEMCRELVTSIAHDQYQSLDHQALSSIQKAKATSKVIVFDFDDAELEEVSGFLHNIFAGTSPYSLIKTRSGVHVLVNPLQVPRERKSAWYKNIMAHPKCDIGGDLMTPVPGCIQGMHIPELHAN